ncbi:hypothetical protein OG979_13805 [Actinomadura citrea]|uniref:hypothetical protein n=1 Tax=Actinomadura citrea TaxID=46158 RepID=UPI002E28D028|nr:hypothetical protein [Actinomadura citrea]
MHELMWSSVKDMFGSPSSRIFGPVALACLVLTACGTSPDAEIEAKPVSTPTPTSMAQLHLPLEAYMPSDTLTAQQGALGILLTNACMKRFGFSQASSGNITESIQMRIRFNQHSFTRRYGITDRAVAAQVGFGMPDWTVGTAKPWSLNDVPPEERTVLQGSRSGGEGASYRGMKIPAGGCMREADRAVENETRKQGGLAHRLSSATFLQLKSEPRVLAASSAWSQCVQEKGYRYVDPWNAGLEFTKEDDTGQKASASEIKAALASVDCNYKTNFLGKAFAVESELQNVEIEKNAEPLEAEKKQNASLARRLQELVKQYGG